VSQARHTYSRLLIDDGNPSPATFVIRNLQPGSMHEFHTSKRLVTHVFERKGRRRCQSSRRQRKTRRDGIKSRLQPAPVEMKAGKVSERQMKDCGARLNTAIPMRLGRRRSLATMRASRVDAYSILMIHTRRRWLRGSKTSSRRKMRECEVRTQRFERGSGVMLALAISFDTQHRPCLS